MVFAFQCFVNNKPLLQSSEMLKTFFACEMVFKICHILVITISICQIARLRLFQKSGKFRRRLIGNSFPKNQDNRARQSLSIKFTGDFLW